MAGTSRKADETDVHIGARIKEKREHLSMSQEALAEKIGVTFQQVQKYEKGNNRIAASMLLRVGHALGVSIVYFFEGLPEYPSALGDQLAEALRPNDAKLLVQLFVGVTDPATRDSILALVRSIAAKDQREH